MAMKKLLINGLIILVLIVVVSAVFVGMKEKNHVDEVEEEVKSTNLAGMATEKVVEEEEERSLSLDLDKLT